MYYKSLRQHFSSIFDSRTSFLFHRIPTPIQTLVSIILNWRNKFSLYLGDALVHSLWSSLTLWNQCFWSVTTLPLLTLYHLPMSFCFFLFFVCCLFVLVRYLTPERAGWTHNISNQSTYLFLVGTRPNKQICLHRASQTLVGDFAIALGPKSWFSPQKNSHLELF